MLTSRLAHHIKQQNTPSTRFLYKVGKQAMRFEVPAPKAVYQPLYALHQVVQGTKEELRQRLYYQPMFRARCECVGEGLLLHCGMPYLYGDLRLRIGKNCKINGHSSFAGGSLFEGPTLTLGDETNIGYGVVISVTRSVTLGSHVRIADGCYISDNPGHPLDARRRREHAKVDPAQVKDVVIEDDVWLGTRVTVLPGVRIGRGTVVGAGSVVTRSLPANCLAAGNPARVIRPIGESDARDRLAAE